MYVSHHYQNMFSISPQLPIKCLSVNRSEKANGNIANKYVAMIANQTGHWKGPADTLMQIM